MGGYVPLWCMVWHDRAGGMGKCHDHTTTPTPGLVGATHVTYISWANREQGCRRCRCHRRQCETGQDTGQIIGSF